MTGAIISHLGPLGIEVQGDGGLLFGLACTVWVAGVALASPQNRVSRGALVPVYGRG